MARIRPRVEDLDDGVQHSYDHRGDTGKFGNIYTKEVERWRVDEDEHEFCVIPFLCGQNSQFRLKNPDLNRPFDDGKIKDKNAWAHKLTVLVHYNIGVNKDAVVCLRTIREVCPPCKERDRLYELMEQETDKEEAEKIKKKVDNLGASKRAIYNVFVFDNDKEMQKGVQIWEAPHNSIEDVLSELYTDRRTGMKKYYTIPEEGWNVLFERKGKGLNTEYRRVAIEKRRKEDDFSEKELGQLYDMAYNLDEIIEIKDPNELETMISGVSAEDQGKPGSEEREDRPASRFRGDRKTAHSEESKKDPPPDDHPKREEKPEQETEDVPKEYQDCFGVMNGQRDECEDCPKDTWKNCFHKSEEARQPKRAQKADRIGGRKALD